MPLGPWELAIILLIVIIIFGVGKLPEIGGALGKGIREFKDSATDHEADENTGTAGTAARKTDNEPIRNETAKEEI